MAFKTIREAVAVFPNAASLEDAIEELRSSGFDRPEISLLAAQGTVDEKLGHIYEKVSELVDDPSVPRTAYISTESRGDAEGGLVGGLMYIGAVTAAGAAVASGGTLAATVAAAAAAGGVGATIGGALALWVERHHADYLQDQLDHGGLLLWVRTRDQAREEKAVDILRRHSGKDVHVHDMPVDSYTSKQPAASDLEKALLDPTLVFAKPIEVIARDDFTRDQKRAILQRWAYDARELEVAEGEGMVGGERDLMDQVTAALRELGAQEAKTGSR
jgi:hypothetical protein